MPEALWALEESRARRALLSPLLLAEGFYRTGAWLHRGVYRWRLRAPARLPVHVVGVGNLSVGGSGKTPFVAWLARELVARGHKVAVLSRGVRGSASHDVIVVSDGERVLSVPAAVGDEPVWLAGAVPGVPVLAGYNRKALGLRAMALFGSELLLLDDGFQHHRLHRDLNLVCLDASLGLGNGHVLPRGPLREPISALRFADALIWTRVQDDLSVRDDPRLPAGPPRFRAQMRARQLRRTGGEVRPLESLRDAEVGLFSAIARPDRLRRDVEACGARVVQTRNFSDHHLYARDDLESLDPSLRWITTAKDAVKIPPDWPAASRIEVIEEEVESPDRSELLDWLEAGLARRAARK